MEDLFATEHQIHCVTGFQELVSTPFHGENMGSIPIEIIFWGCNLMARVSVLHIEGYRFESGHLQVLFFNIFFLIDAKITYSV